MCGVGLCKCMFDTLNLSYDLRNIAQASYGQFKCFLWFVATERHMPYHQHGKSHFGFVEEVVSSSLEKNRRERALSLSLPAVCSFRSLTNLLTHTHHCSYHILWSLECLLQSRFGIELRSLTIRHSLFLSSLFSVARL